MHTGLFFIILGILLMEFMWERVLDCLNIRALSQNIPERLRHLHDHAAYARSQEYTRVRTRFAAVSSTFFFLIMACALWFEGFAWLDRQVSLVSTNDIICCLLFFGVISLVSDVAGLPFEVYSTFVIERKFGFNRTSPCTFAADKIKNTLLCWLLGGLLLGTITWLQGLTGKHFWLYALGVVTLFTCCMSMFYTSIIVPMFNKLQPLEEDSLRQKITEFVRKADFDLQHIWVIDGSKRSSKGNAFFSGFGRQKSIVLYDTLLNELTEEQIIAVLAHEIGHYRKKHILKHFAISCCSNALMLYLLSLCIGMPAVSNALGVQTPDFHIGLLGFGLLYSPASTLTGMLCNRFSRHAEFQADQCAASWCGSGAQLSEALCKLSAQSLANLTPHPLYVMANYSHPTLLQRIEALEKSAGQTGRNY